MSSGAICNMRKISCEMGKPQRPLQTRFQNGVHSPGLGKLPLACQLPSLSTSEASARRQLCVWVLVHTELTVCSLSLHANLAMATPHWWFASYLVVRRETGIVAIEHFSLKLHCGSLGTHHHGAERFKDPNLGRSAYNCGGKASRSAH